METGIVFRKLISTDLDNLLNYLHSLSTETKSRFGPHPFDRDSVISFYNCEDVVGYVAIDTATNSLSAYTIIKKGILQHDKERLLNYNYPGIETNCCTFAPSVADNFQSKGIGTKLFDYILSDIHSWGVNKIILWGGVQAANEKAVNFYRKKGFIPLGLFEYNGTNIDMLLEI